MEASKYQVSQPNKQALKSENTGSDPSRGKGVIHSPGGRALPLSGHEGCQEHSTVVPLTHTRRTKASHF